MQEQGMPSTLPAKPSRTEVMEFLFASSEYGNLGLFIGAGFSKAVLNEEGGDDLALSWGDLLRAASKEMNIEFSSIGDLGDSYPIMASALCRLHSEKNGIGIDDSAAVLRRTLGAATAWYPSEPKRSEYGDYLAALSPAWIVTTNYDQVLECLLSGKSIALGPNDAFSTEKNVVPIFHLHGVRTAPEDIIITQEDYIALFRPSEYRQIRLALTIKESTTCFLGYGLGDVNVLTALDWSKNVFERASAAYPHEVIQVIRSDNPRKPYRRDGIVIFEVPELSDFFKRYIEVEKRCMAKLKQHTRKLKDVVNLLKESKSPTVKRFIDDVPWRRSVLQELATFSVGLVADFELFIGACFAETRRRSNKNGAFQAYATDLEITLDLLTAFSYDTFPPALFPLAAMNLNRLAAYIGTGKGDSWAAYRVWQKRKGELPDETAAGLLAVARQYNYKLLDALLVPEVIATS